MLVWPDFCSHSKSIWFNGVPHVKCSSSSILYIFTCNGIINERLPWNCNINCSCKENLKIKIRFSQKDLNWFHLFLLYRGSFALFVRLHIDCIIFERVCGTLAAFRSTKIHDCDCWTLYSDWTIEKTTRKKIIFFAFFAYSIRLWAVMLNWIYTYCNGSGGRMLTWNS